MADELQGSWKLMSSDGFDDFMKAIGVDLATRMVVGSLKPDVIISKNGDGWCIKTVSTLKSTDLCFKVNEEFDEATADKRNCKTIITQEDGKLTQKQKWDGKECTIIREVQNGQMITTCRCGDVTSRRVYDRK